MIKQTKLIKYIFPTKNIIFFSNNLVCRKFSLSIKNIGEDNFPISEKNHLQTFYVNYYLTY